MSDSTFEIITRSPEQTHTLGRQLGEALTDGLVLSLEGDLGSGKTVFVQGLALGLSVPEEIYVTSPTFSLIHQYPGRLSLFHADLYRLSTLEEAEDIGILDLMTPQNVLAIEWAGKIQGLMPPEGIFIRFDMVNDDTRKISMSGYGLRASDVLRTLS